ncbi:hypothetical protein [Kangiella aquimarina]|uniref:CdiI immunity protein domain-containing protein n=1 Tax=Kangiella aquimarina TaxID=261965 RepID=A0ABZ0X558_9GAMM|nr:hypothetical protein [Kangiella aquimarina]WQG85494.1 hypothetical protein SR900_01115 [Kangiella aquimarina]
MIDINEALTVYLGTDESGGYMPMGQEERLRKHYGEKWKQAMAAIDSYLEFDFSPDWSKHDLNSAAISFSVEVLKDHPELKEYVARALGNRFTYDFR